MYRVTWISLTAGGKLTVHSVTTPNFGAALRIRCTMPRARLWGKDGSLFR